MRIALLSDIHGNSIALDAVLADIQVQGGADTYWVLGDLVAIGPDPLGVLERLARLSNVCYARGNTDRYVVTGERPPPTLDDVVANPGLLPLLLEVSEGFAWTQGAITAAGWLPWLADLPGEQRLLLPDGTRLLGVHATPGADDGDGIHPGLSDAELRDLLDGCAADLVCAGHTHWALDRAADGVRAVNLGSISNPFPPDLRASYVIVDADAQGYRLRHRRVEYDREMVIEAVRRVRHPGADYIVGFMHGQYRPRWMRF